MEDIFIGSSKTSKSIVYMQGSAGVFRKILQPALDADSIYEETDACWVDVNNDKFPDLITVNSGNEFYGKSEYMQPRIYLNDGKGNLQTLPDAFPGLFNSGSCVAPFDFTGDGYIDLFIGARAVPWEYGNTPASYLLENDKSGHFRNVTEKYSKEISKAGFVTDATWMDIDKDGDNDLLLALQWEGICAFINDGKSFSKKWITEKKGWWNFILPFDADGDGDMDIVAGNLGKNSRLTASENEPVKLYYADFDGNGTKEQVLTYYLHGRELPFANKAELEKQMPVLKKKFLYAEDFAKASLQEIFGKEKLNSAVTLTANYFANAILINDGKMNFSISELTWQAQLTPYRDAVVVDVNEDGRPDVMMGGNFYENNIQMGRYDADFGTALINNGKGQFRYSTLGFVVKGQIRKIVPIRIKDRTAFILARNNDSLVVLSGKE